jgi:hypothetical protein
MTFARGVTLTTGTTFGHSLTSNLGPTTGNWFEEQWADDLALLPQLGVTDVRLTLDWARLQPRPGRLDRDWVERFDNILVAAGANDVRVWATLHDGAIPRWVDNEGGLDDDDTAIRWWPRWVERVADHFGDRFDGWIPFVAIPPGLPVQPWFDTWGILRGGPAPVVASLEADSLDSIEDYLDVTDRIGLAIALDADERSGEGASDHAGKRAQERTHERAGRRTDAWTDGRFDRVEEGFGESLHRAADAAADVPLVVTDFSFTEGDADETAGGAAEDDGERRLENRGVNGVEQRGEGRVEQRGDEDIERDPDIEVAVVERLARAVDAAIGDGIRIDVCFLVPMFAGERDTMRLLDRDRAPRPIATAYRTPPQGSDPALAPHIRP